METQMPTLNYYIELSGLFSAASMQATESAFQNDLSQYKHTSPA